MSTETFHSPSMPFILRAGRLSRSEFLRLCRDNPDLRLELTAEGDIRLMTPTTTDGGFRSGEVFLQLKLWSVKDGTGMAFDSSTGYTPAERRDSLAGFIVGRASPLRRLERRRAERICVARPGLCDRSSLENRSRHGSPGKAQRICRERRAPRLVDRSARAARRGLSSPPRAAMRREPDEPQRRSGTPRLHARSDRGLGVMNPPHESTVTTRGVPSGRSRGAAVTLDRDAFRFRTRWPQETRRG